MYITCMVQAHTEVPSAPAAAGSARALATSVASSPQAAHLIGSLFDLLSTLRKGAHDPAATTPILLRLAGDGPRRSCDLAHELHLDQSTVSRHVAALESEGLVQRTPDQVDRRAHLLELTPDGAATAHQRITERVRLFEDATAGWSDDDLATFARLLDDFTTGLRAQDTTDLRAEERTSS
jgi:DNA-binding MarR family transcriptional regulator